MAIIPHAIDIVVADMARSLAFYRLLGLPVPEDAAGDAQVEIETPGGASIGLLSEAVMKQAYPDWVQPVGQRVSFACRCDTTAELDETYARMVAAGFEGRKAPWNSEWGQRYAMLRDPDGNRVDLFV